MRKTFKYRIYANKETIAKTENWLELCRELYNCGLAERIYAYRTTHQPISGYTQSQELPDLKKVFPEYFDVSGPTLQQVIERLDRTFVAFFRRIRTHEDKPGFPRFKGKNRYDSFTLKEQCGWKLEGRCLHVSKVGCFKLRLSRPIQGEIKNIIIKRSSSNKWYAYFACLGVPERKLPINNEVVGIDVGIKSFLTDSDNRHIENPKFLKHSLKELKVRQHSLERAKLRSNRRKKTKLMLSKAYEKVANQRRDFQHKLANEYVRNYGTIVIEKLPIKNMLKFNRLSGDISDCAWGQFFEFLSYKAEEAGGVVLKVNPRNTSKMCSCCGAINKDLILSDRTWVCQSCGAVHDRDYNSAKNLKRLGQSQQAQTCEVAQNVACEFPILESVKA